MYACDHNYVCMFVCVVGGGTCTTVFCSPYYRYVCLCACMCMFVHVRTRVRMYVIILCIIYVCVVGGGTCTMYVSIVWLLIISYTKSQILTIFWLSYKKLIRSYRDFHGGCGSNRKLNLRTYITKTRTSSGSPPPKTKCPQATKP